MVNLLIVDDDITIREGIKSAFDWNQYGINICGVLGSGFEALSCIDENQPDIVILDIKLLDSDGLEILGIIKEKYPNIKVIIISGHDKFEFAQKAVELNAFAYILKPIDIKKLLAKILEAKKVINERFEKIVSDESLNKRLKESLPIMRELFIHEILTDKNSDTKSIRDRAEFLNIDIENKNMAVVIIEMQNIKVKEYDRNLIKYAVMNTAESIFSGYCKCYSFSKDETIGFLVSASKLEKEKMKQACRELKNLINKKFEIALTIGLGLICHKVEGLNESYRQAVDALEYKMIVGNNEIIDSETIGMLNNRENFESDFETFISNIEGETENALKTMDSERVQKIVVDITNAIQGAMKENIKSKGHLFFMLSFYLTKVVVRFELTLEKIIGEEAELYDRLKRIDTIDELNSYLIRFFSTVMMEMESKRKSNNSFLVNKAIDYINKNIYKDISLTSVAQSIYINPTYLSKIFKQEVGESFIEYVIKIKMNEAKRLLKKGNCKVYEIADMLKYKDVNHFAKMFKKVYGVTPTEYRELL